MTHTQTQGAEGAGTNTAGQAAYGAAIADLRYAPQWSDMAEADHQQWDRVAAAILTKACEPWELCFGDPPECGGPLHGVFVAGMIYTERLLASLLNLSDYEHGDGSEDFDADATQSLRNILIGASLWDADENRPVSPAQAATPGVPDSVRALSEAASPDWDTNEATPYILGPPIDGEIDRFEVIARGPHGHAKSGDAIRKWQANRMFAVAAVNFVRTLIAAQPAGQAGDAGEDLFFNAEGRKRIKANLEAVSPFEIGALVDDIEKLLTAPDSTRTGAAETEDFATALVKAWEALPGGHHSTKVVEQWLCETMHPIVNRAREALAARPEAPSDAGWSFDMEAAPRDGTVILLWRKEWGEPSAAYWGLAPMADGAGIATKRHPWVFLDSTNGVNGYEDGGHGPMAWHPMLDAPTPPSDPAPSGQAEG